MTYPEARHAAGTAIEAAGTAARVRHSRAGSLLLGALMIAIPALSALPAAARDKAQPVQHRQADRSPPPSRSSAPAHKSSPPPRKSSPPPSRSSSPPPRSTPRHGSGQKATPSRDSGSHSSGSHSSGTRTSSRTAERRVYRDSGSGSSGSRSGSASSGTATRSQRTTGSSSRDAWRVRTWPAPTRESDAGGRQRDWSAEGDRRYDGSRDSTRNRGTRSDRYRRDHRGNGYGTNYYRNHRHHRYCGHLWGGYYDWGHYHYRGYYPWYWPWWPSVYIESDRYSADDGWGAIDLDVSPERAEIYLDGQYIGIADEYDGFPSYLWLEKGTYDLAIYYEGYETIFRQVSIYPGIVIDVEDRMRSGESIHPDDYGPTSTVRRDARIERNREKEEAARAAEARAEEVWSEDSPVAGASDKVGRLYISVLPSDAAVYLDGHFLGTAGEIGQLSAGMVVQPGDHVIELVRPGFETYRKEIVVPPGERTTIELELDRD